MGLLVFCVYVILFVLICFLLFIVFLGGFGGVVVVFGRYVCVLFVFVLLFECVFVYY